MADTKIQSQTNVDNVILATDIPKPPKAPDYGPGSKVKWDNPRNAPSKRKHVGIDPTGRENQKLL